MLFGSALSVSPLLAQQTEVASSVVASIEEPSLPDAPSSSTVFDSTGVSSAADQAASVPPQVAKRFATTIKPGETALPLSAGDKFQIGIRKQITLGALASASIAAGFGNLNDNRPHYGTDSGAYGERLGAAALRQTTQSIFNFGIYSNLFRSDPRYYVLGPTQSFKKRVIYAASRVVITRQDSGRNAPNYALVSAVMSSALLTNAYYPEQDRDIGRSITGALTSLAIRAGTQQLREFSGDIRQRLHLKH